MVDTHTHLYSRQFADEETLLPTGAGAVRRALEAGVRRMIFPAVSLESFPRLMALAEAFPENISIAVGVHPSDVTPDWREQLREMMRLAEGKQIRAIGEIGLDLHWESDNFELQKEAFEYQVRLALKMGLPIIIHSRDALQPTLEILRKVAADNGGYLPQMVFHSFTGSPREVEEIRQVCDPMFGINGVVTFRNAQPLRDALPLIGPGRILLETDSPYLAPVPWRGKRNESAYIPLILHKIAETLAIDPPELERQTDLNAENLFRLPPIT